MTTASADIIDLLAGLTSGGERGVALAAVRDERPQARENAQRSFEALLEPAAPGTFPLAERYAVAAYVAQLHAFDTATAFYGDLLGDEEPALVAPVAAAAAASATSGPYGLYREPALAGESVEGLRWTPDAEASAALGERLATALAHAHRDLDGRALEAEPLPQLHKKVNRRNFLTLLQISHVAVTDVQVDGKLFLCHFTVFSEVLDSFTRCSRIIIHHSLRFFRREWAELHLPCRIRPAHDFSPT